MPERILGIDPGLNITGFGVIERSGSRVNLVEAGVVRTKRGDIQNRLGEIHAGIREVISSTSPTSMALEDLYMHYERPRTAILMGHARGVICLVAQEFDLPLHHYAATQIKRLVTGSGRAPKGQIQRAICREFGLEQTPEPPDVADALAIALCHHIQQHNRSKFEDVLP